MKKLLKLFSLLAVVMNFHCCGSGDEKEDPVLLTYRIAGDAFEDFCYDNVNCYCVCSCYRRPPQNDVEKELCGASEALIDNNKEKCAEDIGMCYAFFLMYAQKYCNNMESYCLSLQ